MPAGSTGEHQRVVLVGGGVWALEAYAALARRRRSALRQGRLEIVALNPHDHVSLSVHLREVVTEALPLAATRVALREAMPMAAVVPAMVTHVDRLRRVVTYVRLGAAGSGSVERLRYDELVVDAGRADPPRLPGLLEHGFTLRGPGDLARLLARLRLLETAPRAAGGDVVVVHRDAESEELAAALAARTRATTGRRVHLVPSSSEGADLATVVGMHGERSGVTVHRDVHIVAVRHRHVALSDGRLLPADLVVTTGRPPSVPLAGLEHLPAAGAATPRPSSTLALAPGIWAAGPGLGSALVAALSGAAPTLMSSRRTPWSLAASVRDRLDRLGALEGRRPVPSRALVVPPVAPSVARPGVALDGVRGSAAVTTRRSGAVRASTRPLSTPLAA